MNANNEKVQTEGNDAAKKKKSVAFDRLYIRHYKVMLGDNPAVTIGAPISMEWKPILQTNKDVLVDNKTTREEEIYRVDDYERIRPRRKVTYKIRGRRGPSWVFLLRSAVDREQLLERLGVDKKEVQKALREVKRVQRNRWLSLKWYFHPLRTVAEYPGNFVRFFKLMRIENQRVKFIREYKRSNSK